MGDLENMINSGQIDLAQFFLMHPFSASEGITYRAALKDTDYLGKLYIKSNKTYERMSVICNTVANLQKNLIVMTGYRGCGKTNFLRFIKAIADGKTNVESFAEIRDVEFLYSDGIEEAKRSVKNNYEDSFDKIRTTLSWKYYNVDIEEICNGFSDFITERLKGTCKYINFDEGGMGKNKPFSTKLFYMIRNSIDKNLKTENFNKILKIITQFISCNGRIVEENFEEIEFSPLKSFWHSVKDSFKNEQTTEAYDNFLDQLKKLSLEQLLFVYTIWEYAEIQTSSMEGSDKKQLIYLMDNIDIIADGTTDIFQNTIMGIWKFIWDTRNVFAKIADCQSDINNEFLSLYSNTKIVVAMRETTAMHISGHLRDKMRNLMEHFDISADIDKTLIMRRKIDLAKELILRGGIVNKGFIAAVNCLDRLTKDRLLMKNLFLLCNNDYRTSVSCITTVCMEHLDEMLKAIDLIESGNPYKVFGGRGMIYRLIINSFFKWLYFDEIGVTSIKHSSRSISIQSQYGYSCSRIILTILCNKQVKVPERFFVNPEESVRLSDLYDMLKDFMVLDDFINIIDGMYSLRNKRFWNHLVTFDNIWNYSPDVVKNYINNHKKLHEENKNIYIRATSAGQVFVDTICVHFEYFASRFASAKMPPLFMIDDIRHAQTVKKIVEDVYEAVKKCCLSLGKYNEKILNIKNSRDYSEILETPYYYEGQFHEERIIHNHISYLEAYRNYMISFKTDEKKLQEMNLFLISKIEEYLELLRYNPANGLDHYRNKFYSENSKALYNELNVCIEHIKSSIELKNGIEITREYYRKNYDGQVCEFLKSEML